ncbi:MAG TPA: methionyl-tRNA formyltransferase [Nitrospiraceae bacterium]|jgi:methionyl-tRNA formyltransferase|nr:methionyl-tRNA formyltransferase [Nitrospiraceae bacterium]
MRIVFMGTPEFAVPSLKALLRSDDSVGGVVTQPDRPKGRGGALAAPPIKLLSLQHGLPLLQPAKMKDPAFLDALRAWKPDCIVVTAFGRILPPAILAIPPRGCVNVHASLLPKYRGAGPIQWAIINGERETGITTMLMDEGMDTGPMLLQEATPILPGDTAGSLSARLADIGGRLAVETLRRVKEGTVSPRPQDHAQATMAPLLKKEDGLIDWTMAALAIANRIRGMSPWPGAYTYAKDDRLTIWKAAPIEGQGNATKPGTIVEVKKDAILVAAGTGQLAITEIQPANSRRMNVAQYLPGHPLPLGLVLGAGPVPTDVE